MLRVRAQYNIVIL